MRKIIGLLLILSIIFSFQASSILAQGIDATESGQNSEQALEEAVSETITDNQLSPKTTYELFWPVVAGRTRADSLYFLKRFKETFRGWLIFNDVKKTDYQTLLATKRVLEAESLLASSEYDKARQTYRDAIFNIDSAMEKWSGVQNAEQYKPQVDSLNSRLENLRIFLEAQESPNEDVNQEVQNLLQQINKLDGNI